MVSGSHEKYGRYCTMKVKNVRVWGAWSKAALLPGFPEGRSGKLLEGDSFVLQDDSRR